MKLIGMLDSPYVRRVAISLQLLGLPFEHRPLSVFRNFPEFQPINPVVRVPTLVCDDGEVLMDSTLILEYAEALARPRTLLPRDTATLQHDLRLTGLALAASEKSVQIFYERILRPAAKQHQPWVDRISGQLLAAYRELEAEMARRPFALDGSGVRQAAVTVGVAWHFTQQVIADVVPKEDFPGLLACSSALEALPEFRAAPHGEGTYRGGSLAPAPPPQGAG
jgi:glutathione S-transferase